jgi:hypothetical protein
MGVAAAVREPMMLPVISNPANHRSLNGHAPSNGKHHLHPTLRAKGTMCEEAVESDRYPVTRDDVHGACDHDIAPSEPPTPEDWHGQDQGCERHCDEQSESDLLPDRLDIQGVPIAGCIRIRWDADHGGAFGHQLP